MHSQLQGCDVKFPYATRNPMMRLFYGGLKHATTLNRFFFSSLFKLGSVPQEFNSRNTKSENMRNHFCSEELVRLFQS